MIVLPPAARLDAFTVSVAVAELPDAVSAAEPKLVLPSVKATVPLGAAAPLAGVTVAVSWAVPPVLTLAGFAVTLVVVTTGGALTATTTVDDEAANPLAPE